MIGKLLLCTVMAAFLSVVGLDRPGWAQNSVPQCITSLSTENDILSDTDRNYTFGGLLTHSCDSEADRPWLRFLRDWNKGWLNTDNAVFGISNPQHKVYSHFGGLLLYTPNDLSIPRPGKEHGRPYSSLVIYGDSILHANDTVAIKQELQLGLLGLSIGGEIQDAVHNAIGAEDPQGWTTEISRGGEPVFGYALQKKKLICTSPKPNGLCGDSKFDVSANWGVSLGYYTSIKAGLAGRLGLGGKLQSPFWGDFGSSTLDQIGIRPFNILPPPVTPNTDDSNESQDNGNDLGRAVASNGSGSSGDELYVFATGGLSLVLYSAVLQGQFRSNENEVDSSDVKRAVLHASVGIVKSFGDWRVSFSHSLRSPEIEGGKSHRWTSFSVGCMF